VKSNSRLRLAALTAVLAGSFSTLAAGPVSKEGSRQLLDAMPQETQQKLKGRVLEHIDAKIKILQTARSCVRAASNAGAMAACHAQERKQMKDLRNKDRQEVQAR
jgi:hypothetical protein